MPIGPHRLLGFAFASADLLLEIDAQGRIDGAIGASEALSGAPETQLNGRAWRDFIDQRDQPMVEAFLDGLTEGSRGGPLVVGLSPAADGVERAAALTAFRLPGNGGAVSCALRRAAPRAMHDLRDRQAFEAVAASLTETAKANGLELELAMVELGGLGAIRKAARPDAAKALEQRLEGALRAQSHGGAAAAALGGDRYAVVRQRGEAADALVRRLTRLLAIDPGSEMTASARAMALEADASSSQVLRAIRYSLDVFIKDGTHAPQAPGNLSEAVNRSVRRTLVEVGALGQAVSERRFRLVYQPVVALKGAGGIHHHEVLVRFGDNGSPFPMIRMAEELDLIEPLDLAVMEQTVSKLAGDPSLSLAVNVSGRTVCSPMFIKAVAQMLAAKPQVRGRLAVELTESAAIDDMGLADRHLQALRREGCKVYLDDFGAGAASLAYLQQLSLDVVKIDGRYIRELHHGGREAAFIRHLVKMCEELGVQTLAEMVETAQAEEAVRRAGVDYAQGWLYGAAADEPIVRKAEPAPVKPAARRMGSVEGWG